MLGGWGAEGGCPSFLLRLKVKSILEDLDDAEYYGSDHEEREKNGGKGGAPKETVEEELARLVRATRSVPTSCRPDCPMPRESLSILRELWPT